MITDDGTGTEGQAAARGQFALFDKGRALEWMVASLRRAGKQKDGARRHITTYLFSLIEGCRGHACLDRHPAISRQRSAISNQQNTNMQRAGSREQRTEVSSNQPRIRKEIVRDHSTSLRMTIRGQRSAIKSQTPNAEHRGWRDRLSVFSYWAA